MEVLKTAVSVVAVLTATGGALYAGMSEIQNVERRADSKFVPVSEWKDFRWSQIKRDIRELQREIAEAEDPRYIKKLEYALEDLYEYLCRDYPDDREC
jgi:hypothetical protein